MRIMRASGNDIGFSNRGWAAVKRALSAQTDPAAASSEDAYMTSLGALARISSKSDGVDAQSQSEVVRSPGSPWGGREIATGTDYSIEGVLVVEGNVAYPWPATDEELTAAISRDFSEWCDENNKAVVDEIDNLERQLHGDDKEHSLTAAVTSLSKNPDGTVKVTIEVIINVESHESESDRKSRIDEEKQIHYENQRD